MPFRQALAACRIDQARIGPVRLTKARALGPPNRASSFFDFYAHDFELIGGTAGSDTFSTNVLA